MAVSIIKLLIEFFAVAIVVREEVLIGVDSLLSIVLEHLVPNVGHGATCKL